MNAEHEDRLLEEGMENHFHKKEVKKLTDFLNFLLSQRLIPEGLDLKEISNKYLEEM